MQLQQFYFPMLRIKDYQIEQKPRKRVKLDTINYEEYDEFKGQAIEQQDKPKGELSYQKTSALEEIKAYSQILQAVRKNPKPQKKIQQAKSQAKIVQQSAQNVPKIEVVKIEKQIPVKIQKQQKKKQASKQKQAPVSSNWKAFLQKQKATVSTKKHQKQEGSKKYYEFVAIDCEFVKSGEEECLARVSLVNQHGDQLYDSYVKPVQKITDFVTEISGITYSHIKNAPNQDHVVEQIKKKMLNKIVIGHTIAKDLEVCGLKNWSGFKKVIDIAEAHVYSPGGKRVALKKLSFNHLGKVIQEGWHSSFEDATATMDLFLKNKLQILRENKIVKS